MNNIEQKTEVMNQLVLKYGRKNVSDIIDTFEISNEQKTFFKDHINNFEFDENKEEDLYKLDNIYQVKTVSEGLTDSLKLNKEIIASDSITENGYLPDASWKKSLGLNRNEEFEFNKNINTNQKEEKLPNSVNEMMGDQELYTIRGLKKIKEYGSKAIDALRNFDPSVLSKISIASAFVPSASAMGAALPYLINKDNKDDKKMEALDAISDYSNAINDTDIKTDSSIAVSEYPDAYVPATDDSSKFGYDPYEHIDFED